MQTKGPPVDIHPPATELCSGDRYTRRYYISWGLTTARVAQPKRLRAAFLRRLRCSYILVFPYEREARGLPLAHSTSTVLKNAASAGQRRNVAGMMTTLRYSGVHEGASGDVLKVFCF